MRQLIVNADDFGRHELINKAVAEAFAKGILRSATLMPGGAAFADAVAVARANRRLGVGVHFTLVNGNPILKPSEIPSLVTEKGVFYDDYTLFMKHYLQGRVNMAEVKAELAAQLAKMEQTGLKLTHVDSHQHMHTLPGIIDIVLKLAQDAKIKAVRIPKTELFCGNFGGLGQLIGRFGLGTLARLAAHKAHKLGFKTPDFFAGIVAGEAVSEDFLCQLVAKQADGVTEVMLHPGMSNAVLVPYCAWQHDFEKELAAVMSDKLMTELNKHKVRAINFADITR